MKNEKGILLLCMKYNVCTKCPRNKLCEEEIEKQNSHKIGDERNANNETRKICTEPSKRYEPKRSL